MEAYTLDALIERNEAFANRYKGLEHRDTVTEFTLQEGTFFDCAVVHVLTTATLDRLRALYPQGRFEPRRFRPNIIVQPVDVGNAAGFIENEWGGRVVSIGNEVRLGITAPCSRCVMTTLSQGDLPKDPGILRAAAQHNSATSASMPPCCVLVTFAAAMPSDWSKGD